jgi:hypothetical protein
MKHRREAIILIGLTLLATILFTQVTFTNAITGITEKRQPSAAKTRAETGSAVFPQSSSSIQSATANQDIPLVAGWNMISSYITPQNLAIETLLASIESDMVLIKNGAGEVYWPSQGINNIGSWDVHQGYLIYMTNPASLSIVGNEIDPALTPINLLEGSNLIAYLRSQSLPVDQVFESLTQFYMAKNGLGQVYWPDFGVNQIGSMQPGQGYEVYMTGSELLYYAEPANTPTPTPTPNSCSTNPANILANPSFENGTTMAAGIFPPPHRQPIVTAPRD